MEAPSINKAVYLYAKSLKEIRQGLSKHAVQKPLRKAIEIITEYATTVGSEEARKLAEEKFIEIVETTLGVDLSKLEKKIVDEKGVERQVTYRQLFLSTFDDIAEVVVNISQQLPPSKVSKFIEVLLDVAYEKYKSIKE
jgi:hypothetical protein